MTAAAIAATASSQVVAHVSAILLPPRKDNRPRFRLELDGEIINEMTSLPGSTACEILARRGHVGWVEIVTDAGKPRVRRWAGDIRMKPPL